MRISDWSSDVCSADRLATRQPPQAVLDRLRKAGIKAAPTGLAHGTITAVIDSGPVEVTTLRRDVSTDGRHAIVDYTDDWREDAARRDFTRSEEHTSELQSLMRISYAVFCLKKKKKTKKVTSYRSHHNHPNESTVLDQ